MTPDQPIGRLMTLDEALEYYTRCADAEKAMGPLSIDERLIILKSVGKDITAEELQDLLAGKKVLDIRGKK